MTESTTVARPYAKAVFLIALEHKNILCWSKMLKLASLVVANSQVGFIFSNPAFSSLQKSEILIDICEKMQFISQQQKSFIYLLAQNKRLSFLSEIFSLYEKMKSKLEKSIDVLVVSAFDLTDFQKNQLKQSLSNNLSLKVKIRSITDIFLIGGIVIRFDDMIIDGSVRGKLEKIAKAINV